MNRWLPLIVCLSSVLSSPLVWANARSGKTGGFYAGGGAGAGLATVGDTSPASAVQFSSKLGFTAGLFMGWRASRFAAIQADVAFSAKGADASGGGAAGSYTRTYLELPLLLKLMLPLSGRISPYASFGPAFSVLLQAETDLMDGRHIDLTDRTERIDAGIMIGAGASIQWNGAGAVYFDARYNHGLLNYNKAAVSEAGEVTNRAFYVTVGYQTDLSVFASGD